MLPFPRSLDHLTSVCLVHVSHATSHLMERKLGPLILTLCSVTTWCPVLSNFFCILPLANYTSFCNFPIILSFDLEHLGSSLMYCSTGTRIICFSLEELRNHFFVYSLPKSLMIKPGLCFSVCVYSCTHKNSCLPVHLGTYYLDSWPEFM